MNHQKSNQKLDSHRSQIESPGTKKDTKLGAKTMVSSKRGGVVAGTRIGVVIVIPVFLAALVAVFLVVLVLFSGAILVAVLCLDKGCILAWSFGFLFCCCFGWRFRCSLGCCFGLCFYTVGGLGSEGDKTVLLGPKNWNPISSSKCTVLARHG